MKKKPNTAGSSTGKSKKTANHTGKELTDEELAGISGGHAVVSRGVINGSAISLPKPAYPPIA